MRQVAARKSNHGLHIANHAREETKMATWYKLTDKDGYTRKGKENKCLWGENITHTATGKGSQLCSRDLIHVYRNPLIASFMNPFHADFKNPLLWECEANGECAHEGQLKSGFKTVTTIRRIDLPVITLEQRIRISIYCALKQYSAPSFVKWANAWLDGSDRSARAAWAAREAAARAAWAAREAAAWAAREAAARAAEAALWAAARAAEAAAWAAEWAAEAAAREAAARAAAWAAREAAVAAAWARAKFDLLTIIKSVVEEGK
jgi:hypothetical protein